MDPKTIKQVTADSLAAPNYSPGKLALLHTGAMLALSLVTALLTYLLGLGMNSAGGLSGVAIRSVYASAQTIISMVGTFALPFWQVGIVYIGLKFARKEAAEPKDLAEGFRRFGSVLRLTLLLLLIFIGVTFASAYVSTALFMFSPASESVYEALEQLATTSDVNAITTEQLLEIAPQLNWVVVLNFVVMLVLGLPFYYRYRLSEFALMDGAPGALAAMRASTMFTRFHRMQLFKFDLSIWWYHGITLLISLLASGDMLLELLGVTLPINGVALHWILFAVSGIANLLFVWKFGVWYQTAYAHCYLKLKDWAENPPEDSAPLPY